MSRPITNRSALLFALLLLVLAACSEDKTAENPGPADSGMAGSGVPPLDTSAAVRRDLPAGRFQLPTKHTPVPDLWITLPAGYEVKDVSQMPDDAWFIFQSNDPSLADPNAITPGVMKLTLGVSMPDAIAANEQTTERVVEVGDQPAEWHLATEMIDGTTPYLKRELKSETWFRKSFPSFPDARFLNLHIYVGGADSATVEELMRVAESLGVSS